MFFFLRFLLLLLIILNTGLQFSAVGSGTREQPLGPAEGLSSTPFLVDHAALAAALSSAAPAAGVVPPPVDPVALMIWTEPATTWMETALRLIVADSTAPPRAARDLMLLSVAFHDGLLAAAAADRPISTAALFAESASRVLAYNHPLHAETLRTTAESAAWVGVWQSTESTRAVLDGRALGAAVADAVLAWAAADGADAPVGEPLRLNAAPGRWEPTPPFFGAAQFPQWGAVRTVIVGDPAEVRAAAPPAWDSAAMDAERAAFAEAQQTLRAVDRMLAEAWAAGPGTVTPPGMWMRRAISLMRDQQLSTAAATQVYAALGVALHDVAVACWESKYHYQVARPIQWLAEQDPAWQPVLATPPHPSYPSGHAAFSGAASTILAAFFPDAAHQLALEAAAAARSRVVGGIHWPMDGAAGLTQGRAVAEQVLAHIGVDPAPPLP